MRITLLAVVVWLGAYSPLLAGSIYVNSRVGNDAYNGTSAQTLNAYVGPVKTLARAMQLIDRGDILVLTDNSLPYYGSLSLIGSRFSGTRSVPFRLIGNGAVITGAKPIDPQSWTELGGNLWRLTPVRKGHYQLIQNGLAVPRVELPWPAENLPNLPSGAWGVYQGRIYYKSAPADDPRLYDFELAEAETGMTLLNVHDVEISDVTFRHFRVDGINAHDRCRNIVLNGVRTQQNGRAGIAVGGSCRVQIRDGQLTGNHRYSLLISELGEAEVQQTEFDRPPTLADTAPVEDRFRIFKFPEHSDSLATNW